MITCIWSSVAIEKRWQHELQGAKQLINKGLLAVNYQVSYVSRAGQVMIVKQKCNQDAHAMGKCVPEIKDCDTLKSVG